MIFRDMVQVNTFTEIIELELGAQTTDILHGITLFFFLFQEIQEIFKYTIACVKEGLYTTKKGLLTIIRVLLDLKGTTI